MNDRRDSVSRPLRIALSTTIACIAFLGGTLLASCQAPRPEVWSPAPELLRARPSAGSAPARPRAEPAVDLPATPDAR